MKGEKKKSIRGDKWIEEQGLIYSEEKSMYQGMKSSERKLHAYIIILPCWDILDAWKMLELMMRNY